MFIAQVLRNAAFCTTQCIVTHTFFLREGKFGEQMTYKAPFFGICLRRGTETLVPDDRAICSLWKWSNFFCLKALGRL